MKKIFLLFLLTVAVTALVLFLPAGSFNYWQAWVFMAVLFTPAIVILAYFLKHDPEFLERRLRYREKETSQQKLIIVTDLILLIGIFIPGLDYRYGWSNVPVWLVIASDIVVFLAYMFIFFVFRENSYASRIVEVDKKQKVISTGPYAIVRHPMYAALIPMYLCVPLALGSYPTLIFFAPIIVVIILRIFDEEKLLLRNLKGYREYTKKVRYRLIPGIW